MRKWLIEMLGGVPQEDYLSLDDEWKSHRDAQNEQHVTFVNELTVTHNEALWQASSQLAQLQEMLRQKEMECEDVERGRVAMQEARNSAYKEHGDVVRQRDIIAAELKLANERLDKIHGYVAELKAERDTLATLQSKLDKRLRKRYDLYTEIVSDFGEGKSVGPKITRHCLVLNFKGAVGAEKEDRSVIIRSLAATNSNKRELEKDKRSIDDVLAYYMAVAHLSE